MKLRTDWYSQHLQQTVGIVRWGHTGTPVLMFPTAGGDAEECERFLMVKESAGGDSTEFILVQNWFEELKRLVPTDD